VRGKPSGGKKIDYFYRKQIFAPSIAFISNFGF
jgi:hypothetical protein